MKNNWYVLYTAPRAEKRIKDKLEAKEIECYLPLHRRPKVWSDRVKMIDTPLFSSYIFVKCKETEIISLLRIRGVAKVVFHNGHPAVIRQGEIDAIKQFIDQAKEKTLCAGDDVEILAGLMKKRVGKIVKIKKKYLLLHIEQLAATVCINIEKVIPVK